MAKHGAQRLAPVLFAVPFFVASCSLLVDGNLGDIHCTDEGKVGPPTCPAGAVCSGGLCVTVPPPQAKLGRSCVQDADCGPAEVCLYPGSFGGDGDPICSKTCCSSSECDAVSLDLVCWSAVGGSGRFCREASKIAILHLGEALAGAACVGDAACRSGRCEAGHCLDTCCSDTSCTAAGTETACRLESGGSASGSWYCAAPAPTKAEFLASCAVDADCASGLCLEIAGTLRCSMPCCESATCGTIELQPGSPSKLACSDVPHAGTLVRACASVLPATAMGAIGTECKVDQDCRGGVCLAAIAAGSKRACSDACCIDANCMDPAFTCRPHGQGSTWALRCEH